MRGIRPKEIRTKETPLAIIKKISTQFKKDPYSQFMLGIVSMAIRDLFDNTADRDKIKRDASKYIRESLVHAELADVSPEWIRRVLDTMNINY